MRSAPFFALCLVASVASAQALQPASKAEREIRAVVEAFRTSIIKKDKASFLDTLHGEAIPWLKVLDEEGLTKARGQRPEAEKATPLGRPGPLPFIDWIVASPRAIEEKFWNIRVDTDGLLGAVTFDYSFHVGETKSNWGQEYWHLVNTDKGWKISSVIYSVHVNPEPPPAPPKVADAPTLSHAIEVRIQQSISDEHFRGTVLVAREGKILHRAAYGQADAEANVKNALSTRFLIGSLTKSFTAVTVMQLVEAGLLDLHAPISKYLPQLRKDLAKDLTLHRLLKHQSGLPRHLERIVTLEEREISSGEILGIINQSKSSFAPGTRYEYSNLNYHLAALAIEQATGKTFAQVLQERTFGPLGMRDSGVERFSAPPPKRAKGYGKSALGIAQDENNVSYALGSGDIYSTMDDLYAWGQALSGTGLLSAKSRALLFSPESNAFGNYGYGFRIQDYQRSPGAKDHGVLRRHGGSMDGFLSNFHHYVEDDLTVIVLANLRPFDIRNLTFRIKEAALEVAGAPRSRSEFLE